MFCLLRCPACLLTLNSSLKTGVVFVKSGVIVMKVCVCSCVCVSLLVLLRVCDSGDGALALADVTDTRPLTVH